MPKTSDTLCRNTHPWTPWQRELGKGAIKSLALSLYSMNTRRRQQCLTHRNVADQPLLARYVAASLYDGHHAAKRPNAQWLPKEHFGVGVVAKSDGPHLHQQEASNVDNQSYSEGLDQALPGLRFAGCDHQVPMRMPAGWQPDRQVEFAEVLQLQDLDPLLRIAPLDWRRAAVVQSFCDRLRQRPLSLVRSQNDNVANHRQLSPALRVSMPSIHCAP